MRSDAQSLTLSALQGISTGLLIPVAMATALPISSTGRVQMWHAEILSAALALASLSIWRQLARQSRRSSPKSVASNLYVLALGILGWADTWGADGGQSLVAILASASATGLVAHFRAVSWTLRVIAPHWPKSASAALAMMSPSLIAGFVLGLAAVGTANLHHAIFAGLSVLFGAFIGVSLLFAWLLRPVFSPVARAVIAVGTYIMPGVGVIYSLITQTPWGTLSAAAIAAATLIWYNRAAAKTLPSSQFPDVLPDHSHFPIT
ncbi:MAG: hypothetical protein C7B44_01125 [Sulfobacillus thermosulfidooxidans]|uniref:hypothetical protein n=1 Tax=Sulfobacillus TaxID=28033 RepID=UPI000CCFDEED|nr:hypothetical protein [Sulfobacillus sp. hq2]MCY0909880.1 hypothetical protein [Sulfobacillus thermotolerans]POB10240.1 hypothetical protein CO251_09770 [Sulfobacillus sp. hq2]PSR37917.1 MAG: hypothetical protein C7B44_01125 [Sulfobacillus thermosulfidooxidans]